VHAASDQLAVPLSGGERGALEDTWPVATPVPRLIDQLRSTVAVLASRP
jgi:hypothetical protein